MCTSRRWPEQRSSPRPERGARQTVLMTARRSSVAVVLSAVVALLAGCTRSGSAGSSAPPPSTAPAPTPDTTAPPSTAGTAPATTAADWPTYHGTPDRRGVSTSMPAVQGPPKVRQRLKRDGAGCASPRVVGG